MRSLACFVVLLVIVASTAAGQHIPQRPLPGGLVVDDSHLPPAELFAPALAIAERPPWKFALLGAGAGVLLSGAFLYASCGVIFCNEVVFVAIPLAAFTGGVLGLALTHP
jgi:hypothetical protein